MPHALTAMRRRSLMAARLNQGEVIRIQGTSNSLCPRDVGQEISTHSTTFETALVRLG